MPGAICWWRRSWLQALLVFLCVVMLGSARVEAQDTPDAVIEGARKTLETLQHQPQAKELTDKQLVSMRRTLLPMFTNWLLQRLGAPVQIGLPTAVAIDALVTLALGLILVRGVSKAERLRA